MTQMVMVFVMNLKQEVVQMFLLVTMTLQQQTMIVHVFLLMMFVSLGTLQAQTTYKTQTYSDSAKYLGEYKDGKKIGEWVYYKEDGTLDYKKTY